MNKKSSKPKTIGLTGGIGSGKTTVAGFFRDLGIPVFIADEKAREIMETSAETRQEIISLLGEKAYHGQKPDRQYISSKVFHHKELLDSLNRIIHPKVHAHFKAWRKTQDTAYVIYEAAILFENGGEKRCDKTILVTAPKPERIKRVVKRDGSTSKMVEKRMENQWNDDEKIKLADFIIQNTSLSETKTQVNQLHKKLVKPIFS